VLCRELRIDRNGCQINVAVGLNLGGHDNKWDQYHKWKKVKSYWVRLVGLKHGA